MNTENVREWSVDDVAKWLRQEKFASFVGVFTRYRIDGVALCDLQKDRFDSLIKSSMGRDDRASVLWKNINIIKRAKSKNANSNFSSKNNRKVNPQPLGPPEPPQRDYRTDGYPQGEVGVEEETYEVFHEDTEEDIDTFTDDEEIDSDDEYLEPTEENCQRGPPQIPSRPHQLNASWGHAEKTGFTDLQKNLMRRMSERAVSKIPRVPPEQKRNTVSSFETGTESDLYLTPAEEECTYDVPENDAHEDEIYDIPDEPSNNAPTPATRQPPVSQQQSRHGINQGPRIPPARIPQFPKSGGHHHSNDPPAPPIPSRVQPQPITPEEEQEYAFPDGEGQDYAEESGDENYLEPDLEVKQPARKVQPNIQNRRLPTVPQGGAPQVHIPPRPEKPNPPTASVDAPPAIPSRPHSNRRIPNLENSSLISKAMPEFPNGTESTRPDPPRSPPRTTRIPTMPPPINDNENKNSNASSDISSRVQNMKNRFEVDNNNTDSSRRPPPPSKFTRSVPKQFPPQPQPPSPTHTPSPVVQRPVTSGDNSVQRKPGIPSSTSSESSMSSSSSSGSDSGTVPNVPTVRKRSNNNMVEPPSWQSEMPPLPPSSRRPSQPQLPTPNQSSVLQINERLAPSQPPKPTPSASRAPPSPIRQPVPPTPPQKVNELEGHPWYHSNVGRQESEQILHQCRKDGSFIVRNSARGDPANPYSLALWFNGRVRNLQIRLRNDQRYALGSKKENELAFETPVQLIEHHMTNSLILAQDEGKTILKVAAPVFR
ncbi:cell surface glycoprotein 1-like isoform X4 [Lytechinus variegatus]|uniref:cell surface glycoprotein 1-like isoform X4 n=1 Tax=Lytechinus variegatus TaxID=7654 RepID=UPI001BB2351A|nr:cell surface glycoprotein 1-like isoform X4 [Lytechinus variegatus]